MANQTKYNYGALRLKRDTIEFLKDMKDAFEDSYGKKFTMDSFIRQMASAVEDGDPGVWDIYCTKQNQRIELMAKIKASRQIRENKRHKNNK